MRIRESSRVFGGISPIRSRMVFMMICLISGMDMGVFQVRFFMGPTRIFRPPSYRRQQASQCRSQVRQHTTQALVTRMTLLCAEARVGGDHSPPGATKLSPSPQCSGRSMWIQDAVDSKWPSVLTRGHAREHSSPQQDRHGTEASWSPQKPCVVSM